MEEIRRRVVEGREHTDASLVAERAISDLGTEQEMAKAQRALDDLIERDRMVADRRLLKFRDSADDRLARERVASPARESSVALERMQADEGTNAERQMADALLTGERQRADSATLLERHKHEANRFLLETNRLLTDEQLSTERTQIDAYVNIENKSAMARTKGDDVRRFDILEMITHDLRNPLGIISMNAQGMGETSQEIGTRAAANDMSRAAARMDRILNNLLDVARLDAGVLHIVKRRHDVSALVHEVLETYRPLFEGRGMSFAVQIPAESVVASFDHDRIVQVLSNLLGNAMKFTSPKGSIGLRVEQRAGQIEFTLRDSGLGIDPAALPDIFKRFGQMKNENRRGLGLGLYLCRKIVEGHGGRIWAESELGKGSTLAFSIPSN